MIRSASHPDRYIAKDYQLPLLPRWGILLFADYALRSPDAAPMALAASCWASRWATPLRRLWSDTHHDERTIR
jgi:hypothetical protein